MNRVLCGLLFCLLALTMASLAFGQADVPGAKDYPGFTRMPGYYISDYNELQFDSYTFTISENGQKKEQVVEGRKFEFRYDRKEGTPAPSPLQVIRNYQRAAIAAGGKVMYEEPDFTTVRLMKGDKEIWFEVNACNIPSGVCYFIKLIEKQGMKQEVVIDADAMGRSLADQGQVALYGIYFDTGKSDLKPESEPTIAEIAKLLKQKPALKVLIVGHTDMMGDFASNLKLSQARAQSVVSELTSKYGITPARLMPFGNGPYAPVATNKTEEGRAKNRRVELVEIATR